MKHDINIVFEGSNPEGYDRSYLGPGLFEPFAENDSLNRA